MEELIKKTQQELGAVIKRPPLTEKLLSRPPFRFLHDVIMAIVKQTGFMNGLFDGDELDAQKIADKDAKTKFLQKVVDAVQAATGDRLSVKPAKIVAGQEPERTNELLQALAKACKVGNRPAASKTDRKSASNGEKAPAAADANSGGSAGSNKENRQKEAEAEQRKRQKSRKDDEPAAKPAEDDRKKRQGSSKERSGSKDRDSSKSKEKSSSSGSAKRRDSSSVDARKSGEKSSSRSADQRKKRDESDRRSDDDQSKSVKRRSSANASTSNANDQQRSESTAAAASTDDRDRKHHRKKTKEASPAIDDVTDVRQQPSIVTTVNGGGGGDRSPERRSSSHSAKESRSNDVVQNQIDSSAAAAAEIGAKTAAGLIIRQSHSARPASAAGNRPPSSAGNRPGTAARPAPPRVKRQELGVLASAGANAETTKPSIGGGPTVITAPGGRSATTTTATTSINNNNNNNDDDGDFIVESQMMNQDEEMIGSIGVTENNGSIMDDQELNGDNNDHGLLVRKILETKKELESQLKSGNDQQTTAGGQSLVLDAKERERRKQETAKLQQLVQRLTRTSHPLSKLLEFLQEDAEAMLKEMQDWRGQSRRNSQLIREQSAKSNGDTDLLIGKLTDLDQQIADQLDAITVVRGTILQNENRIQKMLSAITKN